MNIKVGDLVMVVKPTICCRNLGSVGMIFKVKSIGNNGLRTECNYCHEIAPPEFLAKNPDDFGFEPSRLIKIDPLDLPETIESENEVSV